MTQLIDLTISEAAELLRTRALGPVELAQAHLERIEALDGRLNCFITRTPELALEQARAAEAEIGAGRYRGPLHGIPLALKDLYYTKGIRTTAGSAFLSDFVPEEDAVAVQRLAAAGAVMLGKLNMHEWALGLTNENPHYGAVRNPWDLERAPGGSSGGSGAALAAGMCMGSLGSDTGGSIRQPAALTGCVGVKPTYGRVSRYGLVAFASSLDQVGPFARDVRSAARILEVIAGRDAKDSTSSPRPVGAYEAACGREIRGLRLGVPEEYFGEGLDPDVAASIRQAIARLEKEGVEVRPVTLPHTRYGIATYYIIATAEASSNLARFDGVRFGLRIEPPNADLATMYGKTREAGFGAEVKRRILLGTYVLSAGYYDAYYRKAQRVRTLIKRDFDRAFETVDAIAVPTSPTPAFRLGEKVDDPLAMYLADVYTLPASLAGIAGMTVPVAPTPARDDRPSLPVGLQLLAPAFEEERLFTLGSAVEALGSTQ